MNPDDLAARLHGLLDGGDPARPEHRQVLRQRLLAAAGPADRLTYTAVPTAIGTIYVASSAAGIAFLDRSPGEADFLARLQRRYTCTAVRDDSAAPCLEQALARWLAGGPVRLRLDLARLTPFERAVLGQARRISRGKVRPYSWIAREIGNPGAVRAVGSALARNPVPLLVPCHRVVAGDGHIGNYSMGGPAMKERLLRLEGCDLDRLQTWARQGLKFQGSRTTHIYCYPTCRHIKPEHLVLFRSAGEAAAAGYRPCKLCRPPAAQARA